MAMVDALVSTLDTPRPRIRSYGLATVGCHVSDRVYGSRSWQAARHSTLPMSVPRMMVPISMPRLPLIARRSRRRRESAPVPLAAHYRPDAGTAADRPGAARYNRPLAGGSVTHRSPAER